MITEDELTTLIEWAEKGVDEYSLNYSEDIKIVYAIRDKLIQLVKA